MWFALLVAFAHQTPVTPPGAAPPKIAPQKTAAPAPKLTTTPEPKSALTWVGLPAGRFHFGCEPQDPDCEGDEQPGSDVDVAAFALMKTEVTKAAWDRCVVAGACSALPPPKDNPGCSDRGLEHPVNCVTLPEATAFCRWVGGRLPTVIEWEYAAKSGGSRVFPWGDDMPWGEGYAHNKINEVGDADGFDGTAPVGRYPAGTTPWGLLDIGGNVWEWTSSDYNPKTKPGLKEIRGGGYNIFPQSTRVSCRMWRLPDERWGDLGFRCAR